MRKYIILPLLLICFVLLCACSESKPNVDVDTGDETTVNTSDTTVIADTESLDVTTSPTEDTQPSETQNNAETREEIEKQIIEKLLAEKNYSPDGLHKSDYFIKTTHRGWGILDEHASYGTFTKEQAEWFVDPSAADEFFEMMQYTMSGSMAGFIEYFGISREDYIKVIEEKTADWSSSKKEENWVLFKYSALFLSSTVGGQYFESSSFIIELRDIYGISYLGRPNWPEYDRRPYEYTGIYFTIDSRLKDYVGQEKFNEFLDKYRELDCNIVNFVEYFDISKEEYIKIIDDYYDTIRWYFGGIPNNSDYYIYPYNPDYLYGTEEMREQYFCRHPELLLSNQEQVKS